MPDTWITLRSGQAYDLVAPNQAIVLPQTTAWSLAQLNRFCGHAARPYSVAEHCLLVWFILRHELGADVHVQFGGLMHDAHESVVGDQHTPGKRELGQCWGQYERRHENVFRTAFAMHAVMSENRTLIKRADLIALATERRDLLPASGPATAIEWECLRGVEALPHVDLMEPARVAAPWTFWRDSWLDKYHELEFARTKALFEEADRA